MDATPLFTRKIGIPICYSYKLKHASAGALFHRQPAIYRIFTQTKLSSIYRRKFLCLGETSRVACNSGEIQTRKILLLFGFYGKIQASVWQEKENFEVLKRCYIQIYPAGFLLCYVKPIDLQHM